MDISRAPDGALTSWGLGRMDQRQRSGIRIFVETFLTFDVFWIYEATRGADWSRPLD